jgi:hypothetical protein
VAVRKLVNAYEGETPLSLAENQSKMGPAGFLGDLNPAFTDIAGGIADTPGPGKAVIRGAYQGRAREQAARIDKALTDAMGPPTDIEQFKKFLIEARKAAADPLYSAWRNTEVHPTEKLKELMPRLEAAGAFNMAEELASISGEPITKSFFTSGANKQFPTTQAWDYVKRGLDRSIDKAYRAGDKTLGRALVNLKGEMVQEIEKTNAGKIWNQARTEFADRSAVLDQIEAGRDTLLGSRSGLSVDELKDELSHLKGPELQARIIGARAAAEEAMGETVRGDTTLRNKLLAPNNRQKLELLLGKQKATKLVETMEQEKYLGDQYQNVVGGSQTTPKKERVNALQAPPALPWNPDITQPFSLLPPSLREQLRPTNIASAWRGQRYETAANQLAPLMITPAGSPSFNDLIQAIQAEVARRGNAARIGGRVGGALSGIVTGPGSTAVRLRAE